MRPTKPSPDENDMLTDGPRYARDDNDALPLVALRPDAVAGWREAAPEAQAR